MARRFRFFHDRRAITPVLSNLLLMVVAVAAMAIATTATYVITTNLRETMSERVVVEDLWFDSSADNIRIFLRNTGKVGIRVSSVYVNHTRQSYAPSTFILEVGEQKWLNVSYICSSGNTYYVDVVTLRGIHVADYYKAS